MAASLAIGIDGLGRAQVVIEAMQKRAADMSILMDRIGAYGEESTMHRFETETAPDGSRWTPSYRAKVEGGQTLTKSGRLRMSMTHASSTDHAEWGTNLIYAGVHQGGGTIRAKGGGKLTFQIPGLGFRSVEEVVMPARPFLGLDSDDIEEIGALTDDYFVEVGA